MNVEQKRRELFESLEDTGCVEKNEKDEYLNSYVANAWWGFNAALDAVEIELPESVQCGDEQYHSWEGMCADEVRAAIESTGLGLKVKS